MSLSGPDGLVTTAADTTATFCATCVDEWVRFGVTDAVIAPGSRSTPMALAITADGRLRVHVHHDERAAGFMALGLGLATGRPALILTTSGTAAVELHPSIVEAHQAKVPMLALTADRPAELRDVGAPQAVDQQHLYGSSVRWFADPGVPDEAMRDRWRSLAARAVLETVGSPPGPVQLNLPFREPLVATPGRLPPGRVGGGSWHGAAAPRPEAIDLDAGTLADAVRHQRGVIVAGRGVVHADAVHTLAAVLHWPVIADPSSGCRLPRPATVSHADEILRVPVMAERLRPDIVLRLGALPASKVVGQWLAANGAWQIGIVADGTRYDPDSTLASTLAVEPSALCERLVEELRATEQGGTRPAAPDGWYEDWTAADSEVASVIRQVLADQTRLTEPAVAREVVASMPAGSHLMVSSSMPVRDVEWYAAPREGLTVHANRGANGIDGVMSTAVGIALGTGARTGILIGDVAFLHDTNALIGASRRLIDLVVVVVDNDGGGIFSFLPQAAILPEAQFELLFGTPHGVDLGALAAAHGCTVTRVDRPAGVGPAVAAAAATGGVHVVIIRTDRATNVAAHEELHAAVGAALRNGHQSA
jgi:2-succinyl-5-enolpyruvyl-6-hydroxy-3-cyclohexene-1-carboxylate synthase